MRKLEQFLKLTTNQWTIYADVAVKTEFVGDLPAHLSCWCDHLGRSDVTVAKVAAPASDPSLRKLQFYSVSGSLGQHISLTQLAKQARAAQGHSSSYPWQAGNSLRNAKKVKRQASKQQSEQQQS